MPFLPALWSEAARWTIPRMILPLLVLSFSLALGVGVVRSVQLWLESGTWVEIYDTSHPAVILERGAVRVEGGAVIHVVDHGNTFLVDPEETIPLDEINTPEYIVVRRHQIIRKRPFQTDTTDVSDIQALVGDPFRFDGQTLRSFRERWGVLVGFGMTLLVVVFLLCADALGALVYVPLAGGLAWILRGKGLGRDFGECARVAFAAYSLLLVIDTALTLAGKSPGACLGLPIWSACLSGLTLWRVEA
jgi:hypothetical protein